MLKSVGGTRQHWWGADLQTNRKMYVWWGPSAQVPIFYKAQTFKGNLEMELLCLVPGGTFPGPIPSGVHLYP